MSSSAKSKRHLRLNSCTSCPSSLSNKVSSQIQKDKRCKKRNKSFRAMSPQTEASIAVQLFHCSLFLAKIRHTTPAGTEVPAQTMLHRCNSQQPTPADSADAAAIITANIDHLIVTEDGHGS